jgi:putative peptidoglycan lipid II flippase
MKTPRNARFGNPIDRENGLAAAADKLDRHPQLIVPTELQSNIPQPRSGFFSLTRQHSAFSATLLLMLSSILSGLLGLVRTKYIASVFGAGHATDAYNAAFNLPDMINYFLVGGVASITLVSMLTRYRESGDEAGADRALSAILCAMTAVLGTGILFAEILAPLYTRVFFPKLDPETAALCTHLTRLLLPAQLFFFAGGVLGSRLLVRKIFVYQALTPLIYNLGIILGGVFLASRLHIDSLAIGVLGGAFVGSLAINAYGALRGGLRFTPVFNLRHPAFVEWLRLSLPLMIGVSLTMADKWIISYFSTADKGALTLLTNAKALFNAPLSVIGMAAGAASLPFFSSLYTQNRLYDFNHAVTRSVSRLICVSLLVSAWLIALAIPIVGLLRGGHYTRADAEATAHYLAIFALSLALWSAQGIYARAFYAARNTLTPAISGTIVTVCSIAIYASLFHHLGVAGLAFASDAGILVHTLALAYLLHRARLVSIATLDYAEIGRALLASLIGLVASQQVIARLPAATSHLGDVLQILAGTLLWAGAAALTLRVSGSNLLQQLKNGKNVLPDGPAARGAVTS